MVKGGALSRPLADCHASVNRIFFLLLLVAAAAFSARAADDPLSANEFTRDFVRLVRESAPTYTVRATRELQVVVKDAKGNDSTVFLYDAYAAYLKSPGEENRILRQQLPAVVPAGDEAHRLDRSRIVPILKPRTWLDEVRTAAAEKSGPDAPEVVYDELNEQLIVAYAEDTPNTLRYLTPEQLDEVQLTKPELPALAAANLQAMLKEVSVRRSPVVMNVRADGNFEASLLAVPEFWTKQQFAVDGEIVVAIPARDHLLITGSKNSAGLAKMRELAASVFRDSPHRLVPTLFVLRDGHFVEFKD